MTDAAYGTSDPFSLDGPRALLVIARVRSVEGLPKSFRIAGDIWYLAGLPLPPPAELQGWVNSELHSPERQLCFALKGRSDDELERLEEHLRCLWFSLQLFGVPAQGPHWVLWHRAGGKWEVRSRDLFKCWNGGPWKIDRDALIRAAMLAISLGKVYASRRGYARLKRGVHALWNALREGNYLDFRLHHFVQALDALTNQWCGEKFAKSAVLLTKGGKQKGWLKEMYDIRSKNEHCAEWTTAIPPVSRRAKNRRAKLRLWQVQNLALYAYCRVLSDKRLLAHFRTDSTIEAFWKLPAAVQRKIWGAPLDLSRFAYKTDSGTEYLAVTGNNPSSIHSHLCLDELLKRYSRYREKEQEA